MIVTGLDIETTGLDFDKGDRIIEVCFNVNKMQPDGSIHHIKTVVQRINPMRSISKEAQQIHNIAYEDLKASPKWEDYGATASRILEATDLMVIHNAEFDWPFIVGEMNRIGMPIKKEVQRFCTMENGRWSTFDGKKPSLKELCWSLGIDYDVSRAHGADYDTQVMMDCFVKGKKLGYFKL